MSDRRADDPEGQEPSPERAVLARSEISFYPVMFSVETNDIYLLICALMKQEQHFDVGNN